MHRRLEMEARLNVFLEKCDRAVIDITKLKEQAQGFIGQLNCEPSELKDRFLSCMKQLDEYIYLVTDFNLALDNLDRQVSSVYTPVHDVPYPFFKPLPTQSAMNLMDALSEPRPSTSKACSNKCPPEKLMKQKIPKGEQLLITFSSASCSSESFPTSKSEKEVNCRVNEMKKLTMNESPSRPIEERNLPAQKILQVDCMYPATIMHVDGLSFWVLEDINEAEDLMIEMTAYYKANTVELSLDELMALTYCAFYDVETDCFYRALFIKLTEEDMSMAEVFLVDTGDSCTASTDFIQPLVPKFTNKPPFARCCHLAGVDLMGQQNKELMEKQELFIKSFISKTCKIKIDDNSSESLGVYVVLQSGETLNEMLVQRGLAVRVDKSSVGEATTARGLPELDEANFNITDCPEYDDPVEAVTGYHNRDEMDICKHYKGGPEKTCFKGRRCTKRHVMKHPDGWTLDRVPVVGKCASLPLPAPATTHRVYVTHVAHFNRFFVHLLTEKKNKTEPLPNFGIVLPPTTLDALVRDMNSPAARMAYKPLKTIPAPGELVAALYPPDEQWYRARVRSSTPADQNVEVMYIDYGNVVWVKEDAIRQLEPRYWALEAQALRCALAGATARNADSRQWAVAKDALTKMIHEHTLQAHIIAREYDEVTVELYDEYGFSIAEQLAAAQYIQLEPYEVIDDRDVKQKMVVP